MTEQIRVNKQTFKRLSLINKEVLKEWIIRLDSNLYEEAVGKLKESDKCFSGLGILADIVKTDINYKWVLNKYKKWCFKPISKDGGEITSYSLPNKVYNYIGLEIGKDEVHRKVENFIDKVYYKRGFKGLSKLLKKIQNNELKGIL